MVVYIIDLGSQYTHVIWRTVRDLGYSPEIKRRDVNFKELKNAAAFILSGGPGNAYKDDLGIAKEIVEKAKNNELNLPILGVCLGHQFIAHEFGGIVQKGKSAEYGITKITIDQENDLFKGVAKEFNVWVSHFDEVKKIPEEFIPLAHSEVCAYEAIKHKKKKIYGVQFHPEVWHTEYGENIISNFLSLVDKIS
ncbi:MAG: GMP synthase subunit A [Candidatus ainarchaeum sp.]|nr:GMP synthase subunit A [Candidatus ainarchaeum sp.]